MAATVYARAADNIRGGRMLGSTGRFFCAALAAFACSAPGIGADAFIHIAPDSPAQMRFAADDIEAALRARHHAVARVAPDASPRMGPGQIHIAFFDTVTPVVR